MVDPTVEFLRTEAIDPTGANKSVAIVKVAGKEVKVEFWYELIETLGKEDVKKYLFVEALKDRGFLVEARNLIAAEATGQITENENGQPRFVDTRDWKQRFLDENPLPPQPISPEEDPLL